MALTDQIVAYWKLDEASGNAADSVGSITLTNTNTVTYTTGVINNGADGGSTNTTKFLANTTTSPLTRNQIVVAFSMNAWVNVYNVTSDKSLFSIISSGGGNRAQCNMRFTNSGDHINAACFPGPGGISGGGSSSTSLGALSFYMASITYDGTNVKIYINGSLETTTAWSFGTGFSGSTTTSILTQYDGGGNETAAAKVDEAGVWSRALTAGEITQLYNSGAGLQYPFVPPTSVKTFNGLAKASVQTVTGLSIASVKSINGLT